ncbi:MAG: sigma-70 family RNA polymerase sigma factor [Planctomycetota bacterium]
MEPATQQQIFSRWLSQHKGLMLKVVRSFAFSQSDRDDLYQEVATQVWKSIPKFNSQSKASTWVYRVALFTATAWARKEDRHQLNSVSYDDHPVPDRPDENEDRLSWLYEQIGRLSVGDRTLCLLMLEGCSHSEVAETLGISEANVGVRAHRIKKKLTRLSKETIHDI